MVPDFIEHSFIAITEDFKRKKNKFIGVPFQTGNENGSLTR
jgi:hypothetical protein